jgi:hypothetical protein
MSSISSDYTDNYGGLKSIKYAIAKELLDQIDWMVLWQNPESINIPQAVIDTHFFDITPIQQTSQHQHSSQLKDSGKIRTHRTEARFTKDRSDIRAQLEHVGDRGVVLLIQDHNGSIKLIGTPEAPMYQTEDYRTGTKMMDTNGYTFYFTGSTVHKPPLVNIT